MKLFKSAAEKEQERKMAVKKAIHDFEKRIEKLRAAEANYIRMAEHAIRENIPQMLENIKNAIQITRTEIKRTYGMLIQTQMISQMKEMTDSTGEFFKTVRSVSQAVDGVSAADMRKITSDLSRAMDEIQQTNEVLSDVMAEASDAVDSFATSTGMESTDAIDDAIYSKLGIERPAGSTSDSSGVDINSELANLKKLLS